MGELERYRWTSSAVDVPFLLGAVGATALSGPALVRLLQGLGRGESAARNILTRMVGFGALEAEPHGRTRVYRLAQRAMPRYHEVEGTDAPPEWTGAFSAVLYSVPERARTLRDRLQHEARNAGYGQLRAGVLIAVGDRWPRMQLQAERFEGGAWIRRVVLTPSSLGEAQAMARTAWDLDDLGRRYGRALDRCARVPPRLAADWTTLRLWRDLYEVFMAAQLDDPRLPGELLPAGWPAGRFLAAQAAVNHRIGNTLLGFLRAQADAEDRVGGNAYYPPPWLDEDDGPQSEDGYRASHVRPAPGSSHAG